VDLHFDPPISLALRRLKMLAEVRESQH
jgi:hypothetical protein